MPYGILKADTITYYTATGDVSVAVSGIAIQGASVISGVSGIFTTSVSGATVTGNAGQFTTLTGGTAQFTSVTGVSGVFTTRISGATVTGNTGQFTTLTAVSGVFTTNISGATISGDAGLFGTISGGLGVFSNVLSVPSGTAGSPSVSFNGDPNTGLYSPGADQVAISTNGTGRLFVDASGNVGIGTSPSTPLHVLGSAGTTVARFTDNSNGSLLFNFSSSRSRILDGGNQALWAYDNSLQNSIFYTGNTERMRLDSSGRLGLGTSSPGQKLEIAGETNPTFRITPNGQADSWSTSAEYGKVQWWNTDYEYGGGGEMASISAGVNNIYGGHGYLKLLAGPNGSMRFWTNSSERMRIDASGNVGIGSTGPSAKLQIDDTGTTAVNSASSSGVNRILVRDASGTTTAGAGAAIDFEGVYGALGRIAFGKSDSSTSGGGRDRGDFYILQNQNGGQDGYGALYETLKITYGDGFVYKHDNNERFRVDTSGRLLVGTSTSVSDVFGGSQLQVVTTGGNNISTTRYSNDAAAPLVYINKSRGALGSQGAVISNDTLGVIVWTGSDGTGFIQGATIKAEVDGTPGTNDMPGRLVFSTTADGASSPTERVRISQNGVVTVKNGAVAEIGTLTDGGTITPDFAANCNFTATISGGSRTLANPSNITAGQTGSIFIIQGAGAGTISWGSYWDFAGGTAPTLTTTSGAVDRVDYVVRTSTSIHTVFTANYS